MSSSIAVSDKRGLIKIVLDRHSIDIPGTFYTVCVYFNDKMLC